jgi:hypothetical protein
MRGSTSYNRQFQEAVEFFLALVFHLASGCLLHWRTGEPGLYSTLAKKTSQGINREEFGLS